MTRTRQLFTGAAALTAVLAIVGGIPWALIHTIGWPLPHRLPTWPQLDAGLTARTIPTALLLKTLAVIVWLGWAALTANLVNETIAAAGRSRPSLPLAGPLQPTAALLIGAITAAVLVLTPRPPPAGHTPLAVDLAAVRTPVTAAAFTPVGSRVVHQALDTATDPAAALPAEGRRGTVEASTPVRDYVVQRGDTLWSIAQRELGQPQRWPDIADLNAHRTQPDGHTMTDPHWIRPGWTLLLPTVASPAATPAAPALPGPAVTPPTAAHLPAAPTRDEPAAPAKVGTDSTAPALTPSPPPSGNGSRSGASLPAATGPSELRPTPSSSPEPGQSAAHGHRLRGPVRLPSGDLIGAELAAGILTALTAARLRRRHRYTPRPPAPARHVAEPLPPPTLRALLTAHHTPQTSAPPDQDTDVYLHADVGAVELPVRTAADLIEAGTRDGHPVHLSLTSWNGLQLRGPGALPTARAWLAALITSSGPFGARILATPTLLDAVLPALTSPALAPEPDIESVLHRLELDVLTRTRQLTAANSPDAATYWRSNPEDPLPLVVAVTDHLPPDLAGRWNAALRTGAQLGIGGLLLSEHITESDGSGIEVDSDGTVTAAHPAALTADLTGARLFQLSKTEAADLLRPVAADHTAQTGSDLSAGRTSAPDLGRDGEAQHLLALPTTDPIEPAETTTTATSSHPPTTATSPATAPDTRTVVSPRPAPPVTVQLLGSYRIHVDGSEIATGLRAGARELLAWYLLHPEGAPAELAIDQLWPDIDPARGPQRFWTNLGNLRTRIRTASTTPDLDLLTKTAGQYRPQTDQIDVDLWHLQHHLLEASAAGDDPDRETAHLQQVVQLYRGDLLDGQDYLWVEPLREEVHRRALDAHLRLAELQTPAEPQLAVRTLERAATLDPRADEITRRLLHLHHQLGRADAVRSTWQRLLTHLAELDLEPDPATVTTYRQLTHPARAAAPTAPADAPPGRNVHSSAV